MPPADAHTGAGTGPSSQAGTGAEDTLDLQLPDEFLALFGEDEPATVTPTPIHASLDGPLSLKESLARGGSTSTEGEDVSTGTVTDAGPGTPGVASRLESSDLLDNPAEWRPVTTPAGVFQLVPVRLERDLAVISRWMNDPAVAAFWELGGEEAVTAAHLDPQLEGDGRSVPCLGVLSGVPMSYWEIYRADLDPLARHYPARPNDTGLHLLIGGVSDRGRGIGTTLLRAVSDLVLDNRPQCARVVAEPDLRNTPSVSAFLSAGFRFSAEVELPDKQAALMIRDRAHRAQL
ncbi:Protein N-acetyltransferase, RimJ/RimL family [Streptomyces sp. 136MFCol5.1]|uniref:GNAT family N-acetyltransferase n=1 Tax=unclassified Streptomyces TaxID=2593676 RepID=UPI000884F209|nr:MULTISPECIES: GNAT family N-acetyltransferase [unclassified Streptomyces]SCZ09679.1 Protein N-acetyltransferase, RimJ/RimL family [Streptomyces sp. 136MFCol5.1]SFT28389.1 Protein N-acetyltransferase, RimJ/RimL family [Streptomyces sp. ok210]